MLHRWITEGEKRNESQGHGTKGEYAITLLVETVSQDYGFPEYSNPQHRGNPDAPMSACRLVAEETGLSERRVEEIWGDRKASVIKRRPPK